MTVIHIIFHTHETIQWALVPCGRGHRYPERDTNAESQSGGYCGRYSCFLYWFEWPGLLTASSTDNNDKETKRKRLPYRIAQFCKLLREKKLTRCLRQNLNYLSLLVNLANVNRDSSLQCSLIDKTQNWLHDYRTLMHHVDNQFMVFIMFQGELQPPQHLYFSP